jgi:hypothetical protein
MRMPDGDTKAAWREQVTELQRALQMATTRMLSDTQQPPSGCILIPSYSSAAHMCFWLHTLIGPHSIPNIQTKVYVFAGLPAHLLLHMLLAATAADMSVLLLRTQVLVDRNVVLADSRNCTGCSALV